MKKIALQATLVLMFSGLCACAGAAKKSTAEFNGTKPTPPPRPTSYSKEIEFGRNSAALQDSDRNELNDFIQKARKNGEIEDIKIVAWSDGEYPDEKIQELSKREQHLADARARSVEYYMKQELHGTHVEHFNMAKRPSILSELLASKDARVKTSLVSSGLVTTNPDLRHPENASKVVVLLLLKPH